MNLDELSLWLIDECCRCESEAGESHRESMNSYGAGYDRGYADAMKDVLDKINGVEK